MADISTRLDEVRSRIQETEFLEGKGLSNEVNIHIFCYHPSEEMAVRRFVASLHEDTGLACRVVEMNLYEEFLAICERKRILGGIAGMEARKGKEFLLRQLYSIATEKEFITQMQYAPHQRGDVLMLTGVGEVFPFMRVHKLLEAMQPYFSDIPILVMYPGEFDGHQLKLFSQLRPNDYYRAFNIV